MVARLGSVPVALLYADGAPRRGADVFTDFRPGLAPVDLLGAVPV